MAAPILYRLIYDKNWGYYDLRILSAVIDYAETIHESETLIDKSLNILDNYSEDESYEIVKSSFHMNEVSRLMREDISDGSILSLKELIKLFEYHSNAALNLYDKQNLQVLKSVVLIRKGFFYKDYKLIESAFKSLEESGEKDMYETLLHEAKIFGYRPN
ncbi:MAG: hypothetical protein FWF57_08410 [Defluviitaleaceae bacterium]|nr:hypothetical protein [Defluviitaleaceae bacterium]